METDVITVNSITENLANNTVLTGCIRKNIETAPLFKTWCHMVKYLG